MSVARVPRREEAKNVGGDSSSTHPSVYLRRFGIELPPDVLRFWDKAGYADLEEGTIEFPELF